MRLDRPNSFNETVYSQARWGERGVYAMFCDRCGGKYRNTEMKKTWDGLWVDHKCWYPRHPQDIPYTIRETFIPPIVRPERMVDVSLAYYVASTNDDNFLVFDNNAEIELDYYD